MPHGTCTCSASPARISGAPSCSCGRTRTTNPNAHFFGRPITLDDHQQSRWIAEPSIRLFDCCQETDGAVAVVITRSDRSQDSRQPVTIEAVAGAAVVGEEIASNHYRPNLEVMEGSVTLAKRLFGDFGIDRGDIDVAMIYDAFTPVLFMQLEGLGFCGPGEAKEFIADGNLALDGALPSNTNGGLIGEGYIHGLNLTTEAVRQSARHLVQPSGESGLGAGMRQPNRRAHSGARSPPVPCSPRPPAGAAHTEGSGPMTVSPRKVTVTIDVSGHAPAGCRMVSADLFVPDRSRSRSASCGAVCPVAG